MGRLLLFMLLCVLCSIGTTVFAADKEPEFDRDQPIEIVSQHLEMSEQQRLSIFTGEVVATQGDMSLNTDKLTVVFQQDQDVVDHLVALGHVVFVYLDRQATAEKAVFYQSDEKLILTGNAKITQGENTISGDEIILFLKENRSLVKSSENRRVKATIIPEKKQENK